MDTEPVHGRRQFLQWMGALPLSAYLPVKAEGGLDIDKLKLGYSQRLKSFLSRGVLPYVDLESSCDSRQFNMVEFAKEMDELGIGMVAMSADIKKNQFEKGVRYDDLSQRLQAAFPAYFIPVGNGGQGPSLLDAPEEFLAAQEQAFAQRQILMLGEFEMRHYPSPRQAQRGGVDDNERDVHVPIDGPTGHRLFALSEKTGAVFQLHYEIEDALLPALEKMLTQYPKARVIWCHLAQVRYIERAPKYGAAYVESLIKRFPNLYWDTAFGGPKMVYQPSGQRHARIWAASGSLAPEWRDLLVAYPHRFVSALDIGGDRTEKLDRYDQRQRSFLAYLPKEVQHQIAYRNAWQLLFGEVFT